MLGAFFFPPPLLRGAGALGVDWAAAILAPGGTYFLGPDGASSLGGSGAERRTKHVRLAKLMYIVPPPYFEVLRGH